MCKRPSSGDTKLMGKQVLHNQNKNRLLLLCWQDRSDRFAQPVTGQTGTKQVRPVAQTGQTGSDQGRPEILKSEHLKINGAKDHNKHKGKKLKLSFDELLAKYLKENDAKHANRSNDVK